MSQLTQLEKLKKQELQDNSLPLKRTATNLVFGEGNSKAKIFFLGEAPGRQEDLTGQPFVGQAGKILNQLLESIGLDRNDVFITSVLHYRPPKNRDPKPSEILAFKPYLDKIIEIIKPKIIVTLGRHSLKEFLPNASIANVHGKPHQLTINGERLTLIPMYHPAVVLYRRNLQKVLEEDFKVIAKELGR